MTISKKDTYSAIGYTCYGRASIFAVSGAICMLCVGMPISYIIIYADSATPLAEALFSSYWDTDYRTVLILLLA